MSSSRPYLTPFPSFALSPEKLEALEQLEAEFALDGPELEKIVQHFLWEFTQGLSRKADTAEEADTFLPMM